MTDPPVERRAPDSSAVEIAKLEGRMDKGFAELNGRLDTMISEARSEREARRASAEAQQKQLDDHESRLRVTEDGVAEVKARPVVTWPKLWAAIVSAVTVAGVLTGIVLGVIRAATQ